MSLITDVVIVAAAGESAAIAELNAWCAAQHNGQQLNELDADAAGGSKVPSMRVYAAAFNYLKTPEFEDAARTAKWRYPHSVMIWIDGEFEPTYAISPADAGKWTPGQEPRLCPA